MSMIVTVERVGPKLAESFLNFNKFNRALREGIAEKYADDMRNGRWTACPEPISFYEDGGMADGQHRLWAVVMSGTTQTFAIARGLTREDGLNLNTGLGRSLIDNARISGTDADLSIELIAICRAIGDGNHANVATSGGRFMRSNAATLANVDAHRDAAQWARANGPRGRNVRNAVVLGAIGRAWYVESDHDRLHLFSDVLSSGLYDSEGETAAVALRNYLMTKTSLTTQGLWRDTFLKAQNAVMYFMRGKKLTTIKGVKDEAYPLQKRKVSKRVSA